MYNSRKIIVITGATRGIGRHCALQLANKETHLVLIARNEKELEKISEECIDLGSTTTYLPLDLSDIPSIKINIEKIKSELGSIDTLINNAGLWIEKSFESGDMDVWDTALDVNLKSVMHMTRYCVEGMEDGGSIIFIASSASRRTYAGGTNYCAAKFGLMGFAGSLFEDVRERSIKVCSILPGVVNTDMHKDDVQLDAEKMIQPQDIAATVKFILSTPMNVCPTEITLMPQKKTKKHF